MGKVQRAVALQKLKEEDVGVADIEKHLYTQVCGLQLPLWSAVACCTHRLRHYLVAAAKFGRRA